MGEDVHNFTYKCKVVAEWKDASMVLLILKLQSNIYFLCKYCVLLLLQYHCDLDFQPQLISKMMRITSETSPCQKLLLRGQCSSYITLQSSLVVSKDKSMVLAQGAKPLVVMLLDKLAHQGVEALWCLLPSQFDIGYLNHPCWHSLDTVQSDIARMINGEQIRKGTDDLFHLHTSNTAGAHRWP